jgi:hypothetical protein
MPGVDSVAKKTIIVSDLSGREVDSQEAVQIIVRYSDARRGQIVLDACADEVEDMAQKGRREGRRGRRPRAAAS